MRKKKSKTTGKTTNLQRKPGRPKNPTLTASIIAAAAQMIFKDGYNNFSISNLIEKKAISNTAIYSRFKNKDALVMAIIKEHCRFFDTPSQLEDETLPPRVQLQKIGEHFFNFTQKHNGATLYRIVLSDAAQTPQLAETFYEEGPKQFLESLEKYFTRQKEKGSLKIKDPKEAADDLFSMLQGGPHMKLVLNLPSKPSAKEIKQHIEKTVNTFLVIYSNGQ